MSSSASGQGFHPPTDWEEFTDVKNDKPPPYAQEPLFEGSYVDDEGALISRPADCSDSTEGGFINHTYQNPTQNLQYPQHPQNPAYPQQLQQDQPSSQYSAPCQPDYGAYGPPPKYTGRHDDANAKLRYDAYAPQRMQGMRQQPRYPAPTAHDPRSFVTYPPPAPGQYVVTQPQGFGGQPHVIIARPILEDPPQDYLGYSIFVTFCCCWIIGFIAISKSRECRRAIEIGNRELAKEKSNAARNTAHASVVFGILTYIVVGVVIGIRVASMTGSL